MQFLNELTPLRLYPNKKKVYFPINEKDKKHGAAIFLMSPSQEQNEKMMNARFLYGNKNLFRSYYIDRDVMTYINSTDSIKELEEDFDEIQEAALSEGMIHTQKVKFKFEYASTMDEKIAKIHYNNDAISYYIRALKLKKCPVDNFTVYFYPNAKQLQKSCTNYSNRSDTQIYSFTDKENNIHVLSYYAYDEKTMDGTYGAYLRNELIYCIIINEYPRLNRKIANATAIALSGQLEEMRKKKDKDAFKYKDSEGEKISNLYLADLIYELYTAKGPSGVKRFLDGDMSVITNIASRRVVDSAKKLYKDFTESNLSSSERKELKDSDFGIPSKRKYPMPDASHVKAAIKMFNHCDPKDEAELAKNIKAKMKKYNVSVDISDKNRLSKYITESATMEVHDDIPGLEYADEGYIFGGCYDTDYYAVLEIIKDFSKEEFDRISFHSTYKESKWIKKRIILRDPNGYPMSFMDVYHFPSDPERAQITTAVGKGFRGHHLCAKMWKKLLDSGFAEENSITKYIWHVHPGNDASEKIAISAGFKKGSDDLDKYGRMTYVYHINQSIESNNIYMPMISTEAGFMLNESAGFIFNEANDKYDTKLKKYLYKERLKNAREVATIYDQVKQRNPGITKTYRELKLYNGLNVYVDTSYYHAMYLKNTLKGNKRTLDMYFDFLNRLMDNSEIKKSYKKITYFFSVNYTRNANNIEDLLDWKKDLNVLSMIAYYIKKDPNKLNSWAKKNIVFIGDNGYFIIDFNNINVSNYAKFKRNITKLLSSFEIIGDDEDEIITPDTNKGTTAGVLEKIEVITKSDISDISSISNLKINHLSFEDSTPKLIDEKSNSSAIFILGANSNSVISAISSKDLKSKNIQIYYKPK